MSTIETTPDGLSAAAAAESDGPPFVGLQSIASTDHKVIGRAMAVTALVIGVAVAVIGVLLGLERIGGDDALLDAGALPQLFTAFRVGLIYGVVAPLLLGIAVAIVPLQVGARSLAFARLAAAGMWTWLGGIVLLILSLATNGGPLGGDADMVDLFLAAHALVVIGLGAIAVSLATTVLTTRAPGMRLGRVPFFSWSVLIASIGLLIVLPVVLGDLIYLFVDHRQGRAIFGGNAGIASWLDFAWTQPTTYLFALPAVGLLTELAPVVFAKRTPLRPVVYGGLALVGIAALGGASQRAHLVDWSSDTWQVVGDLVLWAFFLGLPILGVLQVLGIVGLVAKPDKGAGAPAVSAPFAFAVVGTLMVLTGMIAGAVNQLIDLGLVGTVFEEAALVFVVYGGVLGAMGAITYWMPVWTGYTIGAKQAFGLAALGLIATVLAAAPYLIAGFADQPAGTGIYDYDGPAALWNVLVTVGHALMAVVIVGFLGLVVQALTGRSAAADDDPWHGHTLEWKTTIPAPVDNFAEPPTVRSAEPVFDLRATPSHDGKDG
ncbi:MAG: cbb3-type cytochrome c oxidase subunit I [Desertimonas sp.]